MVEETSRNEIENLWHSQKNFFAKQQTKAVYFRLEQLKRLKSVILKYEKRIAEALWADLHKSYEEAYLTEIGIVLQEVNTHIRHLKKWSKTKRVRTPLFLFPSKSRMIYEPLGVALIIAPWNYPFQLLMNPLIGAISAGCCAMLKPSPHAPATAQVMEEMVKEIFPTNYVAITQGGRNVNGMLLEQRFEMIFFTGSPSLGKVVMKAASKHLTPVVLELGGKSPCIVDHNANLDIAAKRIIWGKTINAGQTCIAPDYLFVHQSVKKALIEKMIENITRMFGENIKESLYYSRIVNLQAVTRLQQLMKHGRIVFGGEVDEAEKYISPTLIDEINPADPIMQEEIFGPLLPIMTFNHLDEVLNYVNSHEKPLAFYYFGKSRQAKKILSQTTSGGSCINDTLMHVTNDCLPFGGVGNSGTGRYHGIESFRAFSNLRSVVITPTWIDMPLKYVPFKWFGMTRRFLG